MELKTEVIKIENPAEYEVIIGQGNFSIKAVDDLYETLLAASPDIKCAVAMNEAKPQLVRVNGNDPELEKLAGQTCKNIGAGHVFVIYVKGAFPIHVLPSIKKLPLVCSIYVATSNPLEILVQQTDLGRSVIGAVDGLAMTSIENDQQKKERKDLKQKLGF